VAEAKAALLGRIATFVAALPPEFRVESAWLFGSWAEGRQREWSDVDIGVVLDREVDWDLKFQVFSLALDFDQDFHAIAVSRQDFEREDAVVVHLMKERGVRVDPIGQPALSAP
jgi:predicted nucleotidyltransferase